MPSQTEISTRAFEEKLKNKPKSLIFSRLADSYRKGGDVGQAISICSDGLALHPEYVTGRIILGRCYLEQENFNDAIKEFTRVCKLDRRNQIAIKMLADVFSKQGMEEKAGDLYNLLLNMDPDNPSIIHLANVFKGNNRRNLFEILGIEEDIKVEPEASEENEPEQDKLQAVQDVLDEIDDVEIDQEEALPDALAEEDEEVTDPTDEAVVTPETLPESVDEDTTSEDISEEAAVAEPTQDAVETAEIPLEQEEETTVPEILPEESAFLETLEDTAVEPESITEDIIARESKTEADPQTDLTLEEEPSLDDILSQEIGVPTETPLMEDIQVEEEPPTEEDKDTVAEAEVAGDVKKEEESTDAVDEIQEEPGAVEELELAVTPDHPDQVAEIAYEELPRGDDISKRMGAMFGEESEDLAVGISEITESENASAAKKPGKASTSPASADITDSPDVSEFSSRIEDMFGDKEEAPEPAVAAIEAVTEDIIVPPVAGLPVEEEMKLAGDDEALADIDPVSEQTVAIDKEILAEIYGSDSDSDIIEKMEGDITETQLIELEVLGISEELELEPSIEDISEESDYSETPTVMIDIEDRIHELDEVLSETERPSEPYLDEIPREPVEDQNDEEETADNSLTEATAVFDRDIILKLASDRTDELEEVTDPDFRDVIEHKYSVSGDDVTSRLDEMFATETAEEHVDEILSETEDSGREPALSESADSIEFPEEQEGIQAESIVDEQLFGEDVASRIDEMFIEDGAYDDLLIDSLPEEIIEDDKITDGIYTETGSTASIEDKEETIEEEEEMLSIDDTIFLNMSAEDELDIVDDQSSADKMSIDTIPDEDNVENNATGEFYTETGETASLEGMEVTTKESEEIALGNDNAPADSNSADEMDVLDDEATIDELLMDSVPDEIIEMVEEMGEFYTESGDIALDEDGLASEEETEISEPEESIIDIVPSGEDIAASLDKMFPEDQFTTDSLVDTILDEDVDEKAVVGEGFYNVSGQDAESASTGEVELQAFEEKEEKESVFREEETFFNETEPLTETADQQPFQTDTGVIPKTESIPDHVLTPTLADIYFQQDQPHLAIQIYKRLLERDPDNDKIAERIAEIEQELKENEAFIKKTSSEKAQDTKNGAGKKSKSQKRRVRDDTRPLKGVKIKKEIKELIKRTKQELEI